MNFVVNGFNIWYIVLTTFVVSFLVTFLVKRLAFHINALDIPNERKIHKKPMPTIGGLTIFMAFLVGYMLFGVANDSRMISVLISSFIIVFTGFIDDVKPIKARWKFLMQTIAAGVVVLYGNMFFSDITIFGYIFSFPTWINMILTIFFIVAVINAINLIDGLDGLCSGICSIYFVTIAIIGFVLNRFGGLDVVLSLIMLGATLGFLIHNFPPAKIFMGDTGSNFLGFIISIIALIGYKAATVTSILIPIILLFIPIMDTLFAIIRRTIKHETIGTPDKEHLHHQLLKMTSSPTMTVLLIYFINAIFSAISILFVLKDTKIAITIYIIMMFFFLFLIFKTNIIFDHKKKNEKQSKTTND